MIRPMIQPIGRRLLRAPFPIASLFADGEQGAWFDPSDISTMFQPDGGAPVTADGQSVGEIRPRHQSAPRIGLTACCIGLSLTA
jgi:hypothetical protein